MHQIQKLEIVGFKSFCDRTEIFFNEGITAIVGPNGCGKSNIADAISWVVGEQSAKSLRTDRMEGVIFNGTQARKSTSMSEVTLTLRLMEGFNPPEGLNLNPEGFTVGRRLYRSGESEYLLDGRRCRLRDIQALFEGTGLGPNSYALIEQGRIGLILSSKPADRRSLIEEAARITLFKSRRTSAEVKLELAQQNLLRVNDIVREIARQLNSLKRQAAKARRYGRLREELREVQKLKMGLEHRELGVRLEEWSACLLAAQESETTILARLSQIEEQRAQSQETCRRLETHIALVHDELSSLKVDAERANNLQQHQESRKLDLEARMRDLERELRALEERSSLARREADRLESAYQALLSEIAQEEEVLTGEQARGELLLGSIRETESRSDELRSLLLADAGRLSDLRNLVVRSRENIQRIETQAGRLEIESSSKAEERTSLLAELIQVRETAEANGERGEQIANLYRAAEAEEKGLLQRLEQLSTEIAGLQEEQSLMQHRYSSLEEVERRRSNYSEGVQKFLSTELPGEPAPAFHTLADHVETDPRFEAAVEDYLNDPLQYILVDGLPDAVQSVERLKRIGAGKCTFMTLRNGHSNGKGHQRPEAQGEGVIGYLDGILRMEDEVRHAFARALPEFASTIVVQDLHTAFRVAESSPGGNFLTLSGESYSPRGTLSAVGERRAMAGFLMLKREKRELEVKLEALRGRIERSRTELARARMEQASLVESIKRFAAETRKLEVEAVSHRHEIVRLENAISKIDQTESVASQERTLLLAEKTEFESKFEESIRGMAEIEERGKSGEDELDSLASRLESLRLESALLQKALANLQSSHAVRLERRSAAESELHRLASEADETAKRIEAHKLEYGEAQTRLRGLEEAQHDIQARIHALARSLGEVEQRLAAGQTELAGQRETLASREQGLRTLHVEREEAMEARGKIEIEKARTESDREHLERMCSDEFHLSLQEILSQIPEGSFLRDHAEVCRQFDQLRDRVEHFGAINMRALEEYQENEERYRFLTSQRADIEKSMSDLQKAIADINQRSVDQFRHAFSKIRENFIDVFQILFKGGQCDLRLMDEADALESGIDIIAQPPGKRLQNVLLLSGGEKALTALALLIAIFRYRPSPFCVLDEVDAPLDDANVTRFTQLVRELSQETQFLLITHNKRTMEIAQTLYGVTMEEPGVSKIVSVDFRERPVALAS